MAYEKCRQLKLDILSQGYSAECHPPGLMRIVGDLFQFGDKEAVHRAEGYSNAEQIETALQVKEVMKRKAYKSLVQPVVNVVKNKVTAMQVHLYLLKKSASGAVPVYDGYVFSYPTDTPKKGLILTPVLFDARAGKALNKLTHCLYASLLKKAKVLYLDYGKATELKDYAMKNMGFTENVNKAGRLVFERSGGGPTRKEGQVKGGKVASKNNTRKVQSARRNKRWTESKS